MANSFFVSYSREDREVARTVAEAARKAGVDVWFDENLHGGDQFRAEIADRIQRASGVIVLWSPVSVASPWVLDEATLALQFGKLIPVAMADAKPPLGFGQLHTHALRDVLDNPNLLYQING